MSLFESNRKRILYALFNSLQYLSLIFFAPVIVAIYFNEFYAAQVFTLIGVGVLLCSYLFKVKNRTKEEIDTIDAMIVVGLIWIIASLLGALPLTLLSELNYFDATFESISAWTTTGFSMYTDVESLPKAVLFFRSLMQWIGGIGIVVAVLSGIFKMGGQRFYFSEARDERIQPNILNTVKIIWVIYLIYTLLGMVLFFVAGMPIFDSLNHSMTGIATGGMSTQNSGFVVYSDNLPIQVVAMLIMLLGGISFSLHFDFINGKFRKVFNDLQLRTLFTILLIAFLLAIPILSVSTIFSIISAITCTGFNSTDISVYPEIFKILLVILMILGASAGSTAGGLKLIRVGVFAKSVSWKIKSMFKPHVVINKEIGGMHITEDVLNSVFQFILLYLVCFVAASFAISSLGFGFSDSMLEVASAQGNVGLSTGIVSLSLHPLGKAVLMISMLIGRLEIFALIALISSFFVKK